LSSSEAEYCETLSSEVGFCEANDSKTGTIEMGPLAFFSFRFQDCISISVWLNMIPIIRGTIVRLRWDNIDMRTVGLVCEEQETIGVDHI
jgi:hypothetical protein